MLRKLGNICCGHKMFLNKIRNIFCVRNKCCARGQTGKHLCRQQCVLVCQGLYLKILLWKCFAQSRKVQLRFKLNTEGKVLGHPIFKSLPHLQTVCWYKVSDLVCAYMVTARCCWFCVTPSRLILEQKFPRPDAKTTNSFTAAPQLCSSDDDCLKGKARCIRGECHCDNPIAFGDGKKCYTKCKYDICLKFIQLKTSKDFQLRRKKEGGGGGGKGAGRRKPVPEFLTWKLRIHCISGLRALVSISISFSTPPGHFSGIYLLTRTVKFRVHHDRWIKVLKTHFYKVTCSYRVSLHLMWIVTIFTNSSEMSCLQLCLFFNFHISGTFLPVLENILL